MPFISTTTSVSVSPETAEKIKSRFGKAIEVFPGKSENWLMLSINDKNKMFFRGESGDCAYIEVSVFGSVSRTSAEKMASLATSIISEELSIAPDRIYVKFEGAENWSWQGNLF